MIDANLEPYAQSFFVKGKEEGLQAGIQKGIQKGKFETVILLLESRFGELTVEQKETVYLLSEKNINQFLKQIWTTQSLQDFFKFVEYP
jgi:hypothetical protein